MASMVFPTSPLQIFYPTNYTVSYTDDTEYREAIRHVFRMTCNILVVPSEGDDEGIDPVTQDEWNFDTESTAPFLDFVYGATQTHPVFQDLYEVAAGLMLSEDPSIGLAILFSYDYFALFHRVLCAYFKFIERGGRFGDQLPSVVELKQRLVR
jgi:hypothetical protein